MAEFSASSGPVEYDVLVGDTAEEALVATPFVSGEWLAGLNSCTADRISAHAIYIRIRAIGKWAFEKMRLQVAKLGKVRARNQ